jgi:hypothetical protein
MRARIVWTGIAGGRRPDAPGSIVDDINFKGLNCLEKRIDERRDGRKLRERDEQAQQDESPDERNQPVFLALARKPPQILKQVEH